jgi:hypothetical protein
MLIATVKLGSADGAARVSVSALHSHPETVFWEQRSLVLKLVQSVAPHSHKVCEQKHDDVTAGLEVVSWPTSVTVRAGGVVFLFFFSVTVPALAFWSASMISPLDTVGADDGACVSPGDMGDRVGLKVGDVVGPSVGLLDGGDVGTMVVGDVDGADNGGLISPEMVGDAVGDNAGDTMGAVLGDSDGDGVTPTGGATVGLDVGSTVGGEKPVVGMATSLGVLGVSTAMVPAPSSAPELGVGSTVSCVVAWASVIEGTRADTGSSVDPRWLATM